MNDDILDLSVPWENNRDANDVASLFQSERDIPPWEEPMGFESEDELEIYEKARRFQKLNLVSGATIDVPVQDYIARHYGKEGRMRYVLAKHVMNVMNLVPADDVMLMLSCTSKAIAVIATAGAGKTTSLQLTLAISKMLDKEVEIYDLDNMVIGDTGISVPRILYLNYNKHNVNPIIEKHREVVAKLNPYIKKKITDDIESSTVHAFCYRWLTAFANSIDIPNIKLSADSEREKLWQAIIVPRWKRFYHNEDCVDWEVIDELYVYKTESMLDWDAFFLTSKFVDTGLDSEFVKSCLMKYPSLKKTMGVWDFLDFLTLMIDVLEKNEKLRNQLQSQYRIIIADENQDFTALMNRLLLLLHNPKLNRLIVVGDPDQTIYAFKGVCPSNVVSLVEQLDDVRVLGLDTNYRCPDKIIDAAKVILSKNVLRFEKAIKTVRSGGYIFKHSYRSQAEQVSYALNILNGNGENNYSETVICYRNNKSALLIGEELYYANIPFKVLDSRRPFNNLVFQHIHSGLQALVKLDDRELNKSLYRFLPLSREQWTMIVDSNYSARRVHLHDYILPTDIPKGLTEALGILIMISTRIGENPCSDFMGAMFQLYTKYYFDFIARNPNPSIGDEDYYKLLLERSYKFWSRPCTYSYLVKELAERNIDRPNAVTLSTFHGLKGLEYDFVIALDFNDSVFPNYFGIDQRYSKNTAMEEKESENRLCYVLVTRVKKELHLMYQENDPSIYIDWLCKSKESGDEESSTKLESLDLGCVSSAKDISDARLQFIMRMTGGR